MKIIIVSDTHGRHGNLEAALEKEGNIDMLLHLGDVEGEEAYIETIAQCTCHMVAGNNDWRTPLPNEKEIQIGKYKIWMTHGHNYYASINTRRLQEAGVARKADVVLFGHTHKPYMELESEPIMINPGSISYPRQDGRKFSYVVMDIGLDGKAKFELKYL